MQNGSKAARAPDGAADCIIDVRLRAMSMTPTILVVDDQADERDAMADLLHRRHYAVEAASNGQEAIDRLRHGDALPALVVLDLNMPVMDGWEFLFHVAEDADLRDVPVVVMSGSPVVQDAPRVPSNVTFLAKPVRPRVFADVIAGMLRHTEPPHATTARVATVTPDGEAVAEPIDDEIDTARYVAPK